MDKNVKPKLLHIVEAMGGGVFSYIVDLSNALVDSFDIYIAYARRPQTPTDLEKYFDKRVHLIEVNNLSRSLHPVKSIKGVLEVKEIVKNVKPDLVHLHSSIAGVIGRWSINGRKVPMFYTPHGYSFLMANYSTGIRNIYRLIEWISGKRYCTTISCSFGEHQESLKLARFAEYVSNGINEEQIQRLLNSIPEEEHEFTVFTLGRICYQKNPALFNEIALKLPQIKFLWIGDGELHSDLTAHNIKVTGWCSREEALKYAVNADVFLLPSLWEGLPISLLEAMYMKKMCVVSNVIGNKDVIENGYNGYICDSVEEYVKAIEACRDRDNVVLIKNASQDIKEKYNTVVMVKEYKNLYYAKLKNNMRHR